MRILGVIFILTFTGCVSTHMKQYVGKDIREVMMDSGPPVAVYDLASGKRAFQYRWGGGVVTTPETSKTTGSATVVGDSVYLSRETIRMPSSSVYVEGCLINYIALFDERTEAWVIKEIRYPKRLVC